MIQSSRRDKEGVISHLLAFSSPVSFLCFTLRSPKPSFASLRSLPLHAWVLQPLPGPSAPPALPAADLSPLPAHLEEISAIFGSSKTQPQPVGAMGTAVGTQRC